MRMEWYQRKLAVLLSAVLILGPVVQVLPVMASGQTVMEIAEFEELDESVMYQTVPYGTTYEDLELPESLSAQVFEVTADEDEDEEVASGSDATPSDASSSVASSSNASGKEASEEEDGDRMVPVIWELVAGPGGLSDYDGGTAGTYVFDAVLAAGGYRVGEAILPFVEVEVLEETLPAAGRVLTGDQTDSLEDAVVTISGTYTYNGTRQIPSAGNIKVKLNGKTVSPSDYDVSVSDNINAGTATVTVTGTGSYSGSAEGTFTIAPKMVKNPTITLSPIG